MSTPPPPPPDRPTEPLRPARIVPEPAPPPAPPPAAVVQERVVAPMPDSSAILVRLEDAVDSLRMGLIVVGLIAAAALGVAIYALLHNDDAATNSGSRSGLASDARVSRVNDRVDRLSRQVQGLRQPRAAATGGAGADVSARVAALERTVRTLSARPAPKDPTQALTQLSGRIDDLRSDVDALKQAQSTTP